MSVAPLPSPVCGCQPLRPACACAMQESQHHSVLELAGFSAAEAANHGVSLSGPACSMSQLLADFAEQAEHCRKSGVDVRQVPEVSAGILLLAASSSWPQG